MPLPPHGRSVLQTKQPFHLPGYSGYVPQKIYRCGGSIASETHSILTDPNVFKSGYSVLSHTNNKVKSDEDMKQAIRQKIMKGRTASWGDQKFKSPMIPGYTGEIPRLINYNGKTYSVATFNAITEFENSQRIQKLKAEELRSAGWLQTRDPLYKSGRSASINYELLGEDGVPLSADFANTVTTQKRSLKKIRNDMLPYKPAKSFEPNTNVYSLPDSDRNKRFMAGYMGFVPRSHEFFGHDFEKITHSALCEFSKDQQKRKLVFSTPVEITRSVEEKINEQKIYRKDGALNSKYTGHVPGGKYGFGRTVWESSFNAKDKFSPTKQPWTSQQRVLVSHGPLN